MTNSLQAEVGALKEMMVSRLNSVLEQQQQQHLKTMDGLQRTDATAARTQRDVSKRVVETMTSIGSNDSTLIATNSSTNTTTNRKRDNYEQGNKPNKPNKPNQHNKPNKHTKAELQEVKQQLSNIMEFLRSHKEQQELLQQDSMTTRTNVSEPRVTTQYEQMPKEYHCLVIRVTKGPR